MARKSWREKLSDAKPHEIKRAPVAIAGMKKDQLMLVPTALMIDRFIRSLPAGSSVTVKTMRQTLASCYRTEVTCPIYTGYHLRTVAEAAFEAHSQGTSIDEITPFWRVIDEKTPTAKRLACGLAFIRTQRRREGRTS